MSEILALDKYGNRIKVSDIDRTISVIPNLNEKRSNISNRYNNGDSFIGVSTISKIGVGESKIGIGDVGRGKNVESKVRIESELVNKESVNTLSLHNCTKGAGSCKEMTDRSLWFYIGTYKSKVTYCPYCGYKTRSN